mmetsp:Transcript_24951/g.31821  ORF Transcript_24951/g.31821 Transcript_24951/m.31821 type:complete len:217 (-) Transcript_24951:1255-1905(-)
MRNDINSLPCMEQPRCLISSCTYDKRLSSDADGNILSTENKLSWEEWTLVEDDGGGSTGNIILIKSRSHERFLVCSPEGQLETVDKFNILNHDGNRWRICQSSSDEKADVAVLMSVEYSKYLIMDNKGDVSCVDKKILTGEVKTGALNFRTESFAFCHYLSATKEYLAMLLVNCPCPRTGKDGKFGGLSNVGMVMSTFLLGLIIRSSCVLMKVVMS